MALVLPHTHNRDLRCVSLLNVLRAPQATLKELHNMYGKYKFMESSLVQQKKGLVTKIPEIKNALNALAFLVKKQEACSSLLSWHYHEQPV